MRFLDYDPLKWGTKFIIMTTFCPQLFRAFSGENEDHTRHNIFLRILNCERKTESGMV